MDATTRFSELVRRPDELVPLGEAAMLIAAHAYPDLAVDEHLAALDDLAGTCSDPTLEGWRRCLFVEAGFAGNAFDYYDPRNSFLNDVLERRTGIPISLAVVGLEVARRLGVRLAGVGMPGHFLLHHLGQPEAFVDPFDGAVLDSHGVRALFHRVAGAGAAFEPRFLDVTPTVAILSRMLANLKVAYSRRDEAVNLAWVLRLRLAVPGTPQSERVELGTVLASAGRFVEAAAVLEEMAATDALAPDQVDRLERRARSFRARLN